MDRSLFQVCKYGLQLHTYLHDSRRVCAAPEDNENWAIQSLMACVLHIELVPPSVMKNVKLSYTVTNSLCITNWATTAIRNKECKTEPYSHQ